MPQLTQDQIERSLMHLGYSSTPDVLASMGGLTHELPQVAIDRIAAVLTYLDSADTAIDTAAQQAQVKAVGSLKFEYGSLISSRKVEATRQLHELSNLVGARILYNKYQAAGGSGVVVDY